MLVNGCCGAVRLAGAALVAAMLNPLPSARCTAQSCLHPLCIRSAPDLPHSYAQEHVLICASPEPSFAPSRSRSAVIANGSLLPRFILTLTLTLFLTLIPCHCPLPPSSLKAEAQPRPPNPTTISALSSPHRARLVASLSIAWHQPCCLFTTNLVRLTHLLGTRPPIHSRRCQPKLILQPAPSPHASSSALVTHDRYT